MMTLNQTRITKDPTNNKLVVTRDFDAPVAQVWQAWTDSEILDQWWAPRPWKAETTSMDFREGGAWLYAMKGPEGESQGCRFDFEKISQQKSYTGIDAFADENGKINDQFPRMHWVVEFAGKGDSTGVRVEITFDSEADMKAIVEMGFEQGFTAAHGNLDELLAADRSTKK